MANQDSVAQRGRTAFLEDHGLWPRIKCWRHLPECLILSVLLTLGLGQILGASSASDSAAPRVEVAFDEECEHLLLREVPKAKKELLVASYLITRPSIVNVFCAAAERKVAVKIKYDERQSEYEGMRKALERLRKAGVVCTAVKFRSAYGQMHDKFIVMDRQKVLTGSYNYTTAATKDNYENLVLIDAPKIAEEFARAFERIHPKN